MKSVEMAVLDIKVKLLRLPIRILIGSEYYDIEILPIHRQVEISDFLAELHESRQNESSDEISNLLTKSNLSSLLAETLASLVQPSDNLRSVKKWFWGSLTRKKTKGSSREELVETFIDQISDFDMENTIASIMKQSLEYTYQANLLIGLNFKRITGGK